MSLVITFALQHLQRVVLASSWVTQLSPRHSPPQHTHRMLLSPPPLRLMKAGFIPKDHESRVSRVSAWSEVVGYAANIALSLNEYQALLQQEQALARKIHSCKRVSIR